MNTPEEWSLLLRGLALAIPTIFALAALRAGGARPASLASGGALVLTLLLTAVAAFAGGTIPAEPALLGVRVDAVTCVMLLMVCGIGMIIVRYSGNYLHGDPGVSRYFRWLLATLSAVTCLVIANNLLVIAIAWTMTSVALHQLLSFYGERPKALVAAHKKFLVSRLADSCLWSSLVVIYANVGSLDLGRVGDWAGAHPGLTPAMQLAAVLVVIAAALKSAQFPFHGWLTQVMEAPTPVSALLHAGVVNIAGFVMIRLAPWMVHATFAQLLLVIIGLVTAVVAALIMPTRVSVKVALAWSTCAQMGFMLVQCGLGAWHLALLHLVAHSLYKAHAFLSAGTVVESWRLAEITTPLPLRSWTRLGISVVVMLGVTALGLILLQRVVPSSASDHSVTVLALLVGLSMVPLFARRALLGVRSGAAVVGRALGVVTLYVVWHAVAAQLMPAQVSPSSALAWGLVGSAFVGLFAVKVALEMRPDGRLARALYPWLFAGLYLDERFTRLTFRVWPPRLPPPAAAHRPISVRQVLEAHT